MRLAMSDNGPAISPVSPRRELGAYEALWLEQGASFKTLAEKFAADPTALPSDFVPAAIADQHADQVLARLKATGVHRFGVRSEEHTSELQSLMRISYAVFCLQKKTQITRT